MKTIASMLAAGESVPEAGTYNEPELNVGDIIGRVKKERVNIPLLRKAVRPEVTDDEIVGEATKLDDYDYDTLEEGIMFDDYVTRGKARQGSMEDRLLFREEMMTEYGPVFDRMMNRLAGGN